jgi:hypothetical protein
MRDSESVFGLGTDRPGDPPPVCFVQRFDSMVVSSSFDATF